jgi:hypothetical protein
VIRFGFALLVAIGITGAHCFADQPGCGSALNTHDDRKIARSCSDDGRDAEQRFRTEAGFHRVVDLMDVEVWLIESAQANARLGKRQTALEQFTTARHAGQQIPRLGETMGYIASPGSLYRQILTYSKKGLRQIDAAIRRLR